MNDQGYLEWLEEQLAPNKSMPTRAIMLLAVALLAALTLAVALVVGRLRSASPAVHSRPTRSPAGAFAASSSADLLLPTSAASFRLGHDLVYTVELHNAAATDLTLEYPIRLAGGSARPATASYVDLTPTGQLINFHHAPPRSVAHIPGHGQATLQLGLHLECPLLSARPGWPTGDSKIAIELADHPKPVVFTFARLFGYNITADLRRACDATLGSRWQR